MVPLFARLLLFITFSSAAPGNRPKTQDQQVIAPASVSERIYPRELRGRFLQITDLHPDSFYGVHAATDSQHACHSGSGSAGVYGAETTDCDSPFSLVNATFEWIHENLKDQIDFVVWTGDNARHDNDENYPRTEEQVVDLNNYVVEKFVEVFGKEDNVNDPDPTNDFVVPIVPTYGNNDILPHNIFQPGPNKWTRRYLTVWDRFIPEEQRHSFARGGWFFTEVIPNRLAVFSLNTIYFFDSNAAVDGCDAKSEPGYEQMEWLRIQLQFLRQRGMKAIISGHVPPARTGTKALWDETCWQKYTLWMRQYRDVVVGSIYGHMNLDHFFFHDAKELRYDFEIDGLDNEVERDTAKDREYRKSFASEADFTVQAKAAYLNELRNDWGAFPTPPKGLSYLSMVEESRRGEDEFSTASKKKKGKKSKKQRRKEKFLKDIGGQWAERFAVDLVGPSVVPNFFPTLRVVDYNITGLENDHPAVMGRRPKIILGALREGDVSIFDMETTHDKKKHDHLGVDNESAHDLNKKNKKRKKKKKPRKPPFHVPKGPSKSAPPGPAYSPQTFTFLSFTQYYANISRINNEPEHVELDFQDEGKKGKKSHKTHEGLRKFKYEVEYDTRNDSTYALKDLTVRRLLDLAERMGREKDQKQKAHSLQQGSEECGQRAVWNLLGSEWQKKAKEKTHLKNRLWREFVKRAFVSAKSEEELDQDFGQ